MKMNFIRATSAACAVLLAACTAGNVLNVQNLNNPDVARAYSTPAGVESIIGTLYQQLNNGWNTTNVRAAQAHDDVAGGLLDGRELRHEHARGDPAQSDRQRSRQPRGRRTTSRTSRTCRSWPATPPTWCRRWTTSRRAAARRASPAAGRPRPRVRAVRERASALGYTALDVRLRRRSSRTRSAATQIPSLSGYQARHGGGAGRDRLGARHRRWRHGGGGIPASGVVDRRQRHDAGAVACSSSHSWKARLRAGVARTPAERAAVNWASVIADATAGITSRHRITDAAAAGAARTTAARCTSAMAGTRCRSMILGMADTSGAYAVVHCRSRSPRATVRSC